MNISFVLNDKSVTTFQNNSTVLLDLIRNEYNLTGTKEGCREGDCGACSVLIGSYKDGKMIYDCINSCLLPINAVIGNHVVTVEGLNQSELSLVQSHYVDNYASQCGFCTPGIIISITNYLLGNYKYNLRDAKDSIVGNLCRCTGHVSIIESLKSLLEDLNDKSDGEEHLSYLIRKRVIPDYFLRIPELISKLTISNESTDEINGKSFLVSGGTDIYVQKQDELYQAAVSFIDSNDYEENIYISEDKCFFKASTTINQIMNSNIMSSIIPDINNYLRLFGSNQIRNRATVGGNIVNASPIADFTSILLALNAEVHLLKNKKERKIPLKDFFIAHKKFDLSENEIVEKVSFPLPEKNFFFNYEKVSKREYLDIASVNTSAMIIVSENFIDHITVSAGGVAPIPLVLRKFSEFMTGKYFSDDILIRAMNSVDEEISPISDIRGSAEYKRLLLKKLIQCHFLKFFPDKIETEIL